MNIIITHLSKQYGRIKILNNINFSFKGPNKYLIKGENGVGKSTMFKAILKQVMYEGNIEIDGLISYQPEDNVFPPYMKVKTFLKTFITLTKDIEDIDRKIMEMLEIFNLVKLNDAYLGSLSKGEKQKVNLIQALLTPSDILLFDEPLSGLDHKSKLEFFNILKKDQRLIIIVSHNIESFNKRDYKLLEFREGAIHALSKANKGASLLPS